MHFQAFSVTGHQIFYLLSSLGRHYAIANGGVFNFPYEVFGPRLAAPFLWGLGRSSRYSRFSTPFLWGLGLRNRRSRLSAPLFGSFDLGSLDLSRGFTSTLLWSLHFIYCSHGFASFEHLDLLRDLIGPARDGSLCGHEHLGQLGACSAVIAGAVITGKCHDPLAALRTRKDFRPFWTWHDFTSVLCALLLVIERNRCFQDSTGIFAAVNKF